MRTRGIRLSTQLSLAFVLILVSYVVLLFGTIAASRSIRLSYEALFSRKDQQTDLAYKINSEMQEAQKQEREFFLTKEPGAAFSVKQYCDIVTTWAMAIGETGAASGGTDGAGLGGALAAAVAEYKEAFSQAVDAWTARGFGAEEGLQRTFRQAALELEKRIAGHAGLQTDYLLLRQLEKDYLLTADPQYVGRVEAQVRSMRSRLAGSPASSEVLPRRPRQAGCWIDITALSPPWRPRTRK